MGLVVLGAHVTAWAYPDTYPPFPGGSPPVGHTLEAEPVLSEPGEIGFPEDGIRIEATQGEYDSSGNEYHPPMTSVWLDERLVFDTHTAHPEMIPPAYAGQRVYYVDLTGDGRRDLLIYTSYGGNGLGALLEQADLLIRRDAGFQHVTLEVYAPTPLEQFR